MFGFSATAVRFARHSCSVSTPLVFGLRKILQAFPGLPELYKTEGLPELSQELKPAEIRALAQIQVLDYVKDIQNKSVKERTTTKAPAGGRACVTQAPRARTKTDTEPSESSSKQKVVV